MILARSLVQGHASGPVLALQSAISFWGGVDAETGQIIEPRHSNFGVFLKDQILLLPATKGSSSGSSVLAEILRLGLGPRAIILREQCGIITTGTLVAGKLYGTVCPVICITSEQDYGLIALQSDLVVDASEHSAIITF